MSSLRAARSVYWCSGLAVLLRSIPPLAVCHSTPVSCVS